MSATKNESRKQESIEEAMVRTGLFDMPITEAMRFANDPERLRRQELAAYAVRKLGLRLECDQ